MGSDAETDLARELSCSACSSSMCGPVYSRSSRKPPSASAAARCAAVAPMLAQTGERSEAEMTAWLPSRLAGGGELTSQACMSVQG